MRLTLLTVLGVSFTSFQEHYLQKWRSSASAVATKAEFLLNISENRFRLLVKDLANEMTCLGAREVVSFRKDSTELATIKSAAEAVKTTSSLLQFVARRYRECTELIEGEWYHVTERSTIF